MELKGHAGKIMLVGCIFLLRNGTAYLNPFQNWWAIWRTWTIWGAWKTPLPNRKSSLHAWDPDIENPHTSTSIQDTDNVQTGKSHHRNWNEGGKPKSVHFLEKFVHELEYPRMTAPKFKSQISTLQMT